MTIKTEAYMVKVLRKFYERHNFVTVREFGVGYGIADLVAYRLAIGNCRRRVANNQIKSLNRVEYFRILAALPDIETKNFVSLKNLIHALPFSEARLKYDLLKFLQDVGYVRQFDEYRYAKINGFIPIAKEIIAVEAKLRDWKKGAIQAKRYQVFADRTYLATLEQVAHRVDHEVLLKHGIGLLLVTGNGVQEIIPAPKIGPRDQHRHQLAGETAWKIYYHKYKQKKSKKNAP